MKVKLTGGLLGCEVDVQIVTSDLKKVAVRDGKT